MTVISICNKFELAVSAAAALIDRFGEKVKVSVRESGYGWGFLVVSELSAEEWKAATGSPIVYDLSHCL